MARFSMNGKVYSAEVVDQISLKDILVFNGQVAAAGLSYTWSQVEGFMVEADAMDDPGQHPEANMILAVTLWASQRAAGDDVTFDETISTPLANIVWLDDPTDRKPADEAGPTKPAAKKAAKTKAAKSSPLASVPADETAAGPAPALAV